MNGCKFWAGPCNTYICGGNIWPPSQFIFVKNMMFTEFSYMNCSCVFCGCIINKLDYPSGMMFWSVV